LAQDVVHPISIDATHRGGIPMEQVCHALTQPTVIRRTQNDVDSLSAL
jgi:hypothetical protein